MPFSKDGIAVSNDGEVTVVGVASGAVVPTTAVPLNGAAFPGGKFIEAATAALYVRYV